MKISEAISKLQSLQAEAGDIPFAILCELEGCFGFVMEPKFDIVLIPLEGMVGEFKHAVVCDPDAIPEDETPRHLSSVN